jgi:hypothetical protein
MLRIKEVYEDVVLLILAALIIPIPVIAVLEVQIDLKSRGSI